MNELIEEFFTSMDTQFHYPLFWYDSVSQFFGKLNKGQIVKQSIPEIVLPLLEDNDVFMKSFTKNGEVLIFYFFRFFLDDRKIIMILQDYPDRNHLNHFMNTVVKLSSEVNHDHHQNSRELEFMREELTECESEVSQYDEKMMRYEDELFEKSQELDRQNELVDILKNSRQKLMKLVDGLENPLFSMDLDYEVNNINRATGDILSIDDLPSFVGRKCFKVIYNNDEVCEWCKIGEVLETKESVTQHIEVVLNDKEYVFSQTQFPVLNKDGEIVEIGEHLQDISEQYRLINSFEKSKERLRRVSKDKIDKIGSLKTEYDKLYREYEESQVNVQKLSKAIEKLLQQNMALDLLKIKTDYKNLKAKYAHLVTLAQNYQNRYNDLNDEMADVKKRSVYSIDRLINVLNNKKEIRDEDVSNVMEFVNGQIAMIKESVKENDELKRDILEEVEEKDAEGETVETTSDEGESAEELSDSAETDVTIEKANQEEGDGSKGSN